jgi:hypothetical protein
MWCRSYRDHVIMAFPSFDTATGLWAPQANISWVVGPLRESKFVRFSKRVLSEEDAVDCASRAARTWVNKRLRSSHNAPPHGADKLTRGVRPSVRGNSMLTFSRFKSLMLKSGLSISEDRLQKSYAALVELRRRNHCSWAQIKTKMVDAQPMTADPQVGGLKTKVERLPLSMRAWRRII